MTSIKDIIPISERVAERLIEAGAHTAEQLLKLGSTPTARLRLADEARLGEDDVSVLVHHADLLRINGVGPEYAHLLYEIGVTTVPKLAYRSVQKLHDEITAYNETHAVVEQLPSSHEIETWVAEAKRLPKIIQH